MSSRSGCSRILAPHRAVGIVSDGATPFALQSLGGEPFVAVSVGHAFQVFEGTHLRVVAVSQRTRHAITSLATKGDRTFVGCGQHLSVWERLHPLAPLGKHKGNILGQVVLGDVLISLCDKGVLKAWDLLHPSLVGRKHRQQLHAPNSAPPPKGQVEDDSSDEEEEDGENRHEPACTASMQLGAGFEEPSCLAHPDTYLNKVVIGSKAGKLGLWNFRTGKKVHEFAALAGATGNPDSSTSAIASTKNRNAENSGGGGGGGSITCLEPSPALDVCAVGFSRGAVVLLHMRADEVLFTFQAANRAPCRSLSFRTDGGFAAGTTTTTGDSSGLNPTLVSAHGDGRVWVWGLAQQQLLGEVNAPLPAHEGGAVLKAAFLPKEPVLLTLGADNALKAWIFDGALLGSASVSNASMGAAGSRLLRSREGHALPPAPRGVRWYFGGNSGGGGGVLATSGHGGDATSLQLLSGSQDRSVRAFHAVRDALSCELSQGKLVSKAKRLGVPARELKLRPVVAMASAAGARSRDWCDVVTAHDQDACVYVWRYENRCLGPHELRQPGWAVNELGASHNPQHFASSVAVSVCGSFALVGTHGGVVYKYNLQSGAARGCYPTGAQPSKRNQRRIDAGDVRQTVKKMKAMTQGTRGPLRNASGAFVHGKHGVGYGATNSQGANNNNGLVIDEDDDDENEEGGEETSEDDGEEEPKELEGGGNGNSSAAAQAADEVAWGRSAAAKHDGRVTGVAVDALQQLVLSCGLDGTLRFWSFANHGLDYPAWSNAATPAAAAAAAGASSPSSSAPTTRVPQRSDAVLTLGGGGCALLELVRDAGLCAVAGDDGAVRIIDVEVRRLVRKLGPSQGHPSGSMRGGLPMSPPLVDVAFSPDARRLYAASSNGTLRVWDLPTGKCVDWIAFSPSVAEAYKGKTGARRRALLRLGDAATSNTNKKTNNKGEDDGSSSGSDSSSDDDDDEDEAVGLGAITSVSVCPTGEFVCTSHAGSVGLHLWSDRTLYDPSVRLDKEPRRPTLVSAPEALAEPAAAKKKDSKRGKAGAAAMEDGSTTADEVDGDEDAIGEVSSDEEDDDEDVDGDSIASREGWTSAARLKSSSNGNNSSSTDAITLSELPRSAWETLFNLEAVRERNKPIAPVKPPPQAPFFLPTLRGSDGLVPTFLPGTTPFAAVGLATEKPAAPAPAVEVEGEANAMEGGGDPAGWGDVWSDDDDNIDDEEGAASSGGNNEAAIRAAALTESAAAAANGHEFDVATAGGGSKLLRQTKPLDLSRGRLAELLLRGQAGDDQSAGASGRAAMALLKSMGPSAVDAELQSLSRGDASFHDEMGVVLLGKCLNWLGSVLESRVDFEAAQAYLHRFLRLHAEAIGAALASSQEEVPKNASGYNAASSSPSSSSAALAKALERAEKAQTKGARHLRELLQQNLCLIQFFSNVQPF